MESMELCTPLPLVFQIGSKYLCDRISSGGPALRNDIFSRRALSCLRTLDVGSGARDWVVLGRVEGRLSGLERAM